MWRWRVLIGMTAAWICLSSEAGAMGSGPHPHVLYGIPIMPTHGGQLIGTGNANPAQNNGAGPGSVNPWEMPVYWVIPYATFVWLVLCALETSRKK